MTNGAKCEDTISASQTLTCSSSRSSTDIECHGIDVDTDGCTANDHNCSSHCSTSDESADTRKSLIDRRMVNDSNDNVKSTKFSIYSKCSDVFGCFGCETINSGYGKKLKRNRISVDLSHEIAGKN